MLTLKITKSEGTPYVAKVIDGEKKSFLTRKITPEQAEKICDTYWPGYDRERSIKHLGKETTIFDSIEQVRDAFLAKYPTKEVCVRLNERSFAF